jgi:hypothetical protein
MSLEQHKMTIHVSDEQIVDLKKCLKEIRLIINLKINGGNNSYVS